MTPHGEILYGLVGFPLGHSFSADYFTQKFSDAGLHNYRYVNFELEDISQIRSLIGSHPSLRGLNVTIPHKLSVIPYLDSLDDTAEGIGAVNCIDIRDGILTGYNTDEYGFRTSLPENLLKDKPQALVLGSGGASRAVIFSLRLLGIDYIIVSRTPSEGTVGYDQLGEGLVRESRLIINTTPLGMHPLVDDCPPIPYGDIGPGHFLYDLTYNPCPTLFMKKGLERGASAMGGYDMLSLQAERSWEIWTGK